MRLYRTIPLPEEERPEITARFFARVDVGNSPAGCWDWMGRRDRGGYGYFSIHGEGFTAHRVAYELLVGAIPQGMQLDHLCRSESCVNPLHLEITTPAENKQRGYQPNSAKTHCANGHPFDEGNTYFDSRGWRGCYACRRAATAKYKLAGGR